MLENNASLQKYFKRQRPIVLTNLQVDNKKTAKNPTFLEVNSSK